MNDEGDIQLIDDMELFSMQESQRYTRREDEAGSETDDLEDSARFHLMPNREIEESENKPFQGL